MTFSDIAKLIASAEITPELSQYWAKRYLRLLDDKYFVLSEKTNNLYWSCSISWSHPECNCICKLSSINFGH